VSKVKVCGRSARTREDKKKKKKKKKEDLCKIKTVLPTKYFSYLIFNYNSDEVFLS